MPLDLSTKERTELQGLLAELVAGTMDKGKKEAQEALDAKLADQNQAIEARIKDMRELMLSMRPTTDEDRAEKYAAFVSNVIKAWRGDGKAVEALAPAKEAAIKAAMQEGTDSEGAYLVPDGFEATIVKEAYQSATILPDCQSFPMSGHVLKMPAQLSGVAVNWSDEEQEATETNPSLGQVTLTAKRLDGYSKVSNELLADSALNVVDWLTKLYGEAIGLEVDNQILNGTGAPVSGLLSAACGYSTVMSTGNTSFSAVTADDFSLMESAIKSSTAAGGRYYLHRTVRHYVRTLKDDTGQYIYSQPGGQQSGELWGYPLKLSDNMPGKSDSAAGKAFGLFGNPKGFMVGRRQGMDMAMSEHVAFLNFQTVFRVGSRWGLAIGLAKAFSPYIS